MILAMAAMNSTAIAQIDSNKTIILVDKAIINEVAVTTPVAAPKEEVLRYNLNESGSHFFKANFLVQAWLRQTELNDGSKINNKNYDNAFDIGIRRARMVLDGQITDRAYIYFQLGMNNFNAAYNSATTTSRKNGQFFIHDAVGDYRLSKGNQLKVGGGLTITNGLSRFSQPSITTIMTLDVPVTLQATTDQTDIFSRKLSVYARGQIKKFDYRILLSDPFPVSSNGAAVSGPKVDVAQFSPIGNNKQVQGYLMYQFFEHEQNNTPYMQGTYLGKKKVFNIASGAVYQKNASWYSTKGGPRGATGTDTIYNDMFLVSLESYLDMPLNQENGTAISAFLGGYYTDYGKNYLRYNNAMNPATGTTAGNQVTGVSGSTAGNAYPMFGTGKVLYAQLGYLLPKTLLGESGQLMPYASIQHANYDRLGGHSMDIIDAGVNLFMKGHKAKVSLDYQNRPTYTQSADGTINAGTRKGSVILQFQLFI